MKVFIEIVDRNYKQIKEFCDYNGISIEDYILQCVEDDFFTRKYGDLNEKINNKKTQTKIANGETEETSATVKKKVGRPKKNVIETEGMVVENTSTNKPMLIKVEEVSDIKEKGVIKRRLKTK